MLHMNEYLREETTSCFAMCGLTGLLNAVVFAVQVVRHICQDALRRVRSQKQHRQQPGAQQKGAAGNPTGTD